MSDAVFFGKLPQKLDSDHCPICNEPPTIPPRTLVIQCYVPKKDKD